MTDRPANDSVAEVTIGLGAPEDYDEAVRVWRASNTARRGGRPARAGGDERVRRHMGLADAFLLVARDGPRVVGITLGMQGRADDGAGPALPGLCHIGLVFVAAERWGQGIGGKLVDAVLREAVARGYRAAQLWTHADNGRSRRLYTSRGFTRSGREKVDDEGETIVQFTRPLP